MLLAHLSRLKQRLQQQARPFIQRFSRSSYRWSDKGRESLGPIPGLPGGGCVLPRKRLLFARLDLTDVPQRQRREAALLELEQQAPFEQPKGWALWDGGRAALWYWPQSLEQQALPAPAPGRPHPEVLPETALWPPLKPGDCRWVENEAEGLYLIQYQHPKQGLYEKRYPRPLEQNEVRAWLQRHGGQADDAGNDLQPVLPPSLSTAGPRGQSLESRASSLEQSVLPGLALLLVFLLVVYGLAWARAWWAAGEARDARQALQAQVEQVIEVRNRASQLRAQNQQLVAIRQASQVRLAAVLAQHLEADNTRLIRWNYRNQRLELSWQLPEDTQAPDATDIIRRLEALPAFSQVQAQVNDRVVEISLNIDPDALSTQKAEVDNA